MSDNKEYFNKEGVIVTNNGIKAPTINYPIAAISAVRFRSHGKSTLPVILGFLSILLIFTEFEGFLALGLAIAAIAFFISVYRGSKPKFSAMVSIASGEKTLLSSTDSELIKELVNSINQALKGENE